MTAGQEALTIVTGHKWETCPRADVTFGPVWPHRGARVGHPDEPPHYWSTQKERGGRSSPIPRKQEEKLWRPEHPARVHQRH